jgi:hypothetical protein
MSRSFKVYPESIERPSGELAAELELPQRNARGPRLLIGRREWIALPDLGVRPLRAKIDSGAHNSSIHAQDLCLSADESRVSFTTLNADSEEIRCNAEVARIGGVRSSTGVAAKRIFIRTRAVLAGGYTWTVLVSLADRSVMRCPMLLGRRALAGVFFIDPQSIHLLGPRTGLPE